MNNIIKIFIAISLVIAAQSGFACDYPSERVAIPAGANSSKEELLATQKNVKGYLAALATYRECIIEEEKLARLAMDDLAPEVEQQREELLNKKYNASVEDEERVAAAFNAAVQDFNKRKD